MDWRKATNAMVPNQKNKEYDAAFEQKMIQEKSLR